jgi:hypothetical protein
MFLKAYFDKGNKIAEEDPSTWKVMPECGGKVYKDPQEYESSIKEHG